MVVLSILKVFILLILINSFYSSFCNDTKLKDFINIDINSLEKLNVGPKKE